MCKRLITLPLYTYICTIPACFGVPILCLFKTFLSPVPYLSTYLFR